MHVYIYDSYLGSKKYDAQIAKIETRLTDLGLNGKIIRMGLLQSLKDSVQNELKKGAKTIIAVGNADLLHQTINSLMSFYSNTSYFNPVPVGFIPVGSDNNSIATNLGIPSNVDACNILSARRIENLDLGQINDKFFLSLAEIDAYGTTVLVDNSYTIQINEPGKIKIINLSLDDDAINKKISAQDGKLEFFIETNKNSKLFFKKTNSSSVFTFKSLLIENKNKAQFKIDSISHLSTPVNIKIAPRAIKLIVGKSRYF